MNKTIRKSNQLESAYQATLKNKIKNLFPGAIILKQDSNQLQGIPDLVIFFKHLWAMLEVKRHDDSLKRPNQGFYVNHFDEMGFARFINPENEDSVLEDLKVYFTEGST